MSVDFADVVPFMLRALPSFRPSEDELRDADLAYMFKGHVVRYACAQTVEEPDLPLAQFGVLLERLLTEGDGNVHDLAIDMLEDICAQPEREKVVFHFGLKTREVWREICATAAGQ